MTKSGDFCRYRWVISPAADEAIRALAATARIPPLLARVLAGRSISNPERAVEFLQPRLAHLSDPFLVSGMAAGVERLVRARERHEPFVIFGDYDVDGVTATALLSEFFHQLGWESSCYLPHRMDEGYGLTREGVENCLAKFPVNLILAVDCGSASCEVIGHLAARGIETIVLDHHHVSSPLPEALAMINPKLGAPDAARELCSAGLAFKFAHALLKRGRELGWPEAFTWDLKSVLDFAALGTVADMVPLTGENRIFARAGLERLTHTSRCGLAALKEVAGIRGEVGSYEIGFQLGPRLNAAGRLETALDALDLLLCTDPARANDLASSLDSQNKARQALEQSIVDEALAQVRSRFNPDTDFAIVEGAARWHIGVVGIVASRVLREFYRPVFILGGDGGANWRGSGRSIEGVDLALALRECRDVLLKHGGHAMAAGVTLDSSRIDEFRKRFNEVVRKNIEPDSLQPVLKVDAEVRLKELDFQTVKTLARIEPTGQGNPPVKLVAKNLRLTGECKRFGGGERHFRFNATDGTATQQFVWWNCPPDSEISPEFDAAFTPELTEYQGSFGVRHKIVDIRMHTS